MSNFNTSGLLQALDRIKPELKPLPQHFITSQDQHTRELYATLLAAVLLSDGQVSEPQSRLFGMLLQSMQLEPVPARFFELAQQLDAGQLKGAIRGIQPVGQSFALDALILARLSSPLNQHQLQLIAELFDLLAIKKVGKIIKAVNFQLGLKELSDMTEMDSSLAKKSPILYEFVLETFSKNGVLVNESTGLMWTKYSLGQVVEAGNVKGSAIKYTSYEADELIRKINEEKSLLGYSDWRLPAEDEFKKCLSVGKAGYGLMQDALLKPNSTEFGEFWTGSSHRRGVWNSEQKYLNFDNGSVGSEPISFFGSGDNPKKIFARLVRDISKKTPSETTDSEIQF